jgi:alpha-ketoglutarate-dependent dioxygenase alkB family protein 2
MNNNKNTRATTSLVDNFNVHYKPDFLDKKKADKYLAILEDKLEYISAEKSQVTIYGKKFYIPRKQVAYGKSGLSYKFSGVTVKTKDWNEKNLVCTVIRNIKHRVEVFTKKKFNFVLINRYEDGSDNIGYHCDDEKELGDDASIIGVSFGSERDFKFKAKKGFIPKTLASDMTFVLHHGSLVAMNNPTNKYWMHSLPPRARVKKPRISLTFRYIH